MSLRESRWLINSVRLNIKAKVIKNRREAAAAYAGILRELAWGGEVVDVSDLNMAIIERWSRSGLDRIKKDAWKICTESTLDNSTTTPV